MFPRKKLSKRTSVVLYLDRIDRGEVTAEQDGRIRAALHGIWPRLVRDLKSKRVEGPIAGVIVKLDHESNSDSRTHCTVRLFDQFNHNVATFHAPMPGPRMHIPYYGLNKYRDGWNFANVLERYTEDLGAHYEVKNRQGPFFLECQAVLPGRKGLREYIV
ncbi:hypothetical protein P691DRAFT_791853 [Macrolepiota fuliginosa MF-IS2]|uniref:Uncharacterized protein n=1 Tax=Macrolepiota fuliginosa MF-IS2 TaxID=1400762 RepID=A0A9P5WY80_9AGAR|nr:hypothetical protein P691DRAFT_791853 [Macrolepiota fuliginosa MF-IS2]